MNVPPPPYLTEAEIAEICAPLTNGAAQLRYLKTLGLIVHRKPNGRPLVARAEFERVLVGGECNSRPADISPPPKVNIEGFMQVIGRRRVAYSKELRDFFAVTTGD